MENANLVFNRKKQEKQLQEELKEKDKTLDNLYKEVGWLTLKVTGRKKLGNLAFEQKRQMVNPA